MSILTLLLTQVEGMLSLLVKYLDIGRCQIDTFIHHFLLYENNMIFNAHDIRSAEDLKRFFRFHP